MINTTHIYQMETTKTKEKQERFRRLAQVRTDAVLQKVRILGNCANKSAYDYSEEEVNKMFGAIEEQLKVIKAKFKKPRKQFKF